MRGKQGDNSLNKDDDFERYKLLIDLVEYAHKRWDVMFRTLLTIHGFIIAAIVVLLKGDGSTGTCILIIVLSIVLSIVGIGICWFGFKSLSRIHYDGQLRFYQLREYERLENGNGNVNEKDWRNIFLFGKAFLDGKIDDNVYKEILQDENCKEKITKNKINYLEFAKWINCLIGVFYVVIIFYGLIIILPWLQRFFSCF